MYSTFTGIVNGRVLGDSNGLHPSHQLQHNNTNQQYGHHHRVQQQPHQQQVRSATPHPLQQLLPPTTQQHHATVNQHQQHTQQQHTQQQQQQQQHHEFADFSQSHFYRLQHCAQQQHQHQQQRPRRRPTFDLSQCQSEAEQVDALRQQYIAVLAHRRDTAEQKRAACQRQVHRPLCARDQRAMLQILVGEAWRVARQAPANAAVVNDNQCTTSSRSCSADDGSASNSPPGVVPPATSAEQWRTVLREVAGGSPRVARRIRRHQAASTRQGRATARCVKQMGQLGEDALKTSIGRLDASLGCLNNGEEESDGEGPWVRGAQAPVTASGDTYEAAAAKLSSMMLWCPALRRATYHYHEDVNAPRLAAQTEVLRQLYALKTLFLPTPVAAPTEPEIDAIQSTNTTSEVSAVPPLHTMKLALELDAELAKLTPLEPALFASGGNSSDDAASRTTLFSTTEHSTESCAADGTTTIPTSVSDISNEGADADGNTVSPVLLPSWGNTASTTPQQQSVGFSLTATAAVSIAPTPRPESEDLPLLLAAVGGEAEVEVAASLLSTSTATTSGAAMRRAEDVGATISDSLAIRQEVVVPVSTFSTPPSLSISPFGEMPPDAPTATATVSCSEIPNASIIAPLLCGPTCGGPSFDAESSEDSESGEVRRAYSASTCSARSQGSTGLSLLSAEGAERCVLQAEAEMPAGGDVVVALPMVAPVVVRLSDGGVSNITHHHVDPLADTNAPNNTTTMDHGISLALPAALSFEASASVDREDAASLFHFMFASGSGNNNNGGNNSIIGSCPSASVSDNYSPSRFSGGSGGGGARGGGAPIILLNGLCHAATDTAATSATESFASVSASGSLTSPIHGAAVVFCDFGGGAGFGAFCSNVVSKPTFAI